MKILDLLEQKLIFRLLRALTLIVIVGLAFGAGFGVNQALSNRPVSYVSLSDVSQALGTNPQSTTASQTQDNGMPTPLSDDQLRALGIDQDSLSYFQDSKNRQVITGWLATLDTADAKRDFLKNMNEVVEKYGRGDKKLDINDVINKYKELKLEKLKTGQFDQYADAAKFGAIVLFIILVIALIGLFSLVLVLLAIERNTRKEAVVSASVSVPVARDAGAVVQ